MPKLKEVLVQLLEPFKISMMIFTPALLLVLGGFHFMSPTVLSQLIDLRKEEVNEAVVKEVTARIDAVVDKKLTGENIGKTTATGALTKADKEVINKSIQKQVEEETKKATKDELENLAKTLKADLYKDISLSVIFAIASIFAAFAVKDILTEILKREDKANLRDEIIEAVEEKVGIPDESKKLNADHSNTLWSITLRSVDDIMKKNTTDQRISISNLEVTAQRSIDEFNKKLCWIEYELASLSLQSGYSESIQKCKLDEPLKFHEYVDSHMSRIERILKGLRSIDANREHEISFLETYEKYSTATITGDQVLAIKKSNNVVEEVEDSIDTLISEVVQISIARAGLVMGEIKDKGDLEERIENYKNEFRRMRDSHRTLENFRNVKF